MTPFQHVIAVEGVQSVDKRLCLFGSLTWETPLPVEGKRAEGEWGVPIVGTIDSIQRQGAFIVASGSWFGDEPPRDPEHAFCIFVDRVEYAPAADAPTVEEARIRAVFLGQAAWPECNRV